MKSFVVIFFVLFQIICSPPNEKAKRTLQTEKSNDIIILHTNDVHCGVQDIIGYDGLMLYKKQLQKKYNNVMLVDAGDHIQGGTIGQITNGEAIINIMNKLEYEVATIGDHEFHYGIKQLEKIEKLLDCGYISSNYCFKKNKTSIYPPTKIIEKGGKKIGFIGVATPQTLSKTFLISILDENGENVYDFLTDNHSQELYDRIQQHIDELKKQNCDFIIILGHLGMYGDALEENTSAGLLKNLKGINSLIDGHSHKVYSMTSPDKDGKNVILVQTGTKLANIGVLTLHENGTLSHFNLDKVPYDPELADETLNVTRNQVVRHVDKEMNGYINDIYSSFSDKLNEVIGKSDFPLNVFKNASESTDYINLLSGRRENALCNLVTDAMRELGEADVSIMNAGAVPTDIKQGNITYQDIINIMPFSNDVLVKEVTGQTILEALDFGVRSLPDVTTRFPQVSGITFKVDTSINSTVVIDENEVFEKLGDKQRVYDIRVNGEKLDLNKTYTLSSNSFILGGGDGYTMFSDCETVKTAVALDNEAVIKYIRNNLNGTISNKYKTSEGRMIITNGKTNENISISLLGFDNLTITPQLITFNDYIVSLEKVNFEFPKQLNLKTTLTKTTRLRALQETEKEALCIIQNEVNETTAKYLCEIPNDNSDSESDINTIKVKTPNITNFNVKLGPYAGEQMSNLKEIDKNDKSLADLVNKTNYILQNCTYEANDDDLVISGFLYDDVTFSKNDLDLTVLNLDDNEKTNLKCKVVPGTEYNCRLECKMEPNTGYELENSILTDGDKVLITNFKEGAKTTINPRNINQTNSLRINYKKSSGLKGGYIALIVVIPVVAVAIVAALALLLRKPSANPNVSIPQESTNNMRM